MIICTWNVRGMNKPHKAREVRRCLQKHQVTFVGLLETKVKNHNITNIQKLFGSAWRWHVNNNRGSIGRIWVGWQTADLDVKILDEGEQAVLCEVTAQHQAPVVISVVYGKNDARARQELWRDLLSHKRAAPWLISGDFNAILKVEDRLHGGTMNEIQDFEGFIDNAEVYEVPSKGPYFSWSNKGIGHARNASRIDRGLVSKEWLEAFAHTEVVYQAAGL